jgi:hypothetical protein
MARLSQLSDVFEEFKITAQRPHALIRPQDEDFVERLIPFAYNSRYPHEGLDHGRPTPGTTSLYGFSVGLQTPGPVRKSIWFRLNNGGTVDPSGYLDIQFPDVGVLADPSLAETVFRASVEYWAPAWAWLIRTGPASEQPLPIYVGWRTYLGVPDVIERIPAGSLTERIPPGGMLVSLHGEPYDSKSPDQVAEARSIQDALTRRGLLRRRVWIDLPPDSEVLGRGLRVTSA